MLTDALAPSGKNDTGLDTSERATSQSPAPTTEQTASAKPVSRGTSNGNARGNTRDRELRKLWLLKTYAANTRVLMWRELADNEFVDACRCYRCGILLTFETVTVDRIVPGCKGGKYVRNNIRPSCAPCNSETGGRLKGSGKTKPEVITNE